MGLFRRMEMKRNRSLLQGSYSFAKKEIEIFCTTLDGLHPSYFTRAHDLKLWSISIKKEET